MLDAVISRTPAPIILHFPVRVHGFRQAERAHFAEQPQVYCTLRR